MKKAIFARGLSTLIIGLLFASSSINDAVAAIPTASQMRDAVATFPKLKNSSISAFERKDGARQATVTIAGEKRGTLVGYIPKGKNKVFLALIIDRATIGDLLGTAVQFGFDDVELRDVTLLMVPLGDHRKAIMTKDLPDALSKNLGAITTEFKAKIGLTLFARLEANPAGVVGDALKLIGLTNHDDITIQATRGTGLSAILKKKSRWSNPFQLQKVNGRTTYLEGLTVEISGTKKAPKVAGWGQVNLNRKNYFLFAQYSKNKGKPGKAYGIDAKSITLQTITDFAAAMPWARGLPTGGLNKLPLDQIRLSNPNYKPYDTKSDKPPAFRNMMLVAATPGVKLPDRKTVSGTAGLIKGTPGPFVYANAAATIFGQRIASLEAIMDINGLKADAKLSLKSVGPMKFAGGLDFKLAPKGRKSSLNHEITLTGRTSIHGLPELSLTMAVDRDRMSYAIPASCPLNPLKIKASVPSGAGLVLNGIKDFNVDVSISDCYSKAIIAVVKDPRKLVGLTQNLAEDQIALGVTAATAIGAGIADADKTLKSAWKGSIDAGQTAANTVKNLDKKIAGIGKGIAKAGKAITDLSKGIKSIGKSIAKAFTGITGLKKKRKKKKRARTAQRSKKKKLEQKQRSASAARSRAKKALGKMSPYFNADVVEARTTLSGLRFERKLAAERKKFAAKLKSDFVNSTSRRGKLIAAVNANAIMAEFLSIKDGAAVSAADLNKRLQEKRGFIEEQIVNAAFDKAMEGHMANVKPDPEPEVPFGVPIRIVGEYNLCLEAYRGVVPEKADSEASWSGGSFGRQMRQAAFRAARFKKDKLRINHCHAEDEKPHDNRVFSTQRFMMTPAGKLLAMFGKENVCFEGSGAAVSTTLCKNHVSQVFFYDPTITSIRPMLAKKGKEPRCLQRRYSARAGAQVQLSPCNYKKSGNSVHAYQQWQIAKWTAPLPKIMDVPKLSSLWTNYGEPWGKATYQLNNGVVNLDGLIKLRIADQGGKTRNFAEPIDILPPALRPDKRLIFNANSHFGISRIDIRPNGRVQWVGGNKKAGWVSLDNISYPVKTGKPLKLNSGCKNYKSASFRTPSYSRSGNQVVLSGLMACKFQNNKHIATLPKGHRPSKILVFAANTHEWSARIDVHPNGKVWWNVGYGIRHGWVSLDGIVFDLPKTKKTALPLVGDCKTYPVKKFAAPTITSENGTVRLSGLVDCPFRLGHGHNFAKLPKGMRPAKRLVFNVNAHEMSVRVNVLPNGLVRLEHGWRQNWTGPRFDINPAKRRSGRGWISLDGVSFSISGAKNMALKW